MELLRLVYQKDFQDSIDEKIMRFLMESIVEKIKSEAKDIFSEVQIDSIVKDKRSIVLTNKKVPNGLRYKINFHKGRILQIGMCVANNDFDLNKLNEFTNNPIFNEKKYVIENNKSWVIKKNIEKHPYSFESRSNLIRIYSETELKEEAVNELYNFMEPYLKELNELTESLKSNC